MNKGLLTLKVPCCLGLNLHLEFLGQSIGKLFTHSQNKIIILALVVDTGNFKNEPVLVVDSETHGIANRVSQKLVQLFVGMVDMLLWR